MFFPMRVSRCYECVKFVITTGAGVVSPFVGDVGFERQMPRSVSGPFRRTLSHCG